MIAARRLCLAAFLVLALPATTAELPALTGRVVDRADMIDPATEASLTSKLEAFEEASSDQIVVATVPDLGGEPIEPYSNRLFRAWGLGQAGEDNGVLLLVSRDDRKMRIEVGYGLEGTLTDLHSRLIIENTMLPAFRAGDFSGGIDRAVDDIVTVLKGDAAELEARHERNQQAPSQVDWFVVAFLAVWALIFFGALIPALLAPFLGKKIGPRRYRWLGMVWTISGGSSSPSSGWSSGGGGWSSGGGGSRSGGFSGGGGSSGGGGASGGW